MTTQTEQEVSDERIYEDLKAYQEGGLIEYVLPTEPLGEQWIVGWNGQILKFVSKEGVVGFLAGLQVCAMFVAKMRNPDLTQSLPVLSALLSAAGYDPVEIGARQKLLDLWPDPTAQWTAEQADAARAVKDGIRRILGVPARTEEK